MESFEKQDILYIYLLSIFAYFRNNLIAGVNYNTKITRFIVYISSNNFGFIFIDQDKSQIKSK
jgi:hypothetical protein